MPYLLKTIALISLIAECYSTKLGGFNFRRNLNENNSFSYVQQNFYPTQYEAVRFWNQAFDGPRVNDIFLQFFQNQNWLRLWYDIPTGLRESAVGKLLPFVIKNEGNFSCSKALTLCLTDYNCRTKIWKYLDSCSKMAISFRDWIMTSSLIQTMLNPSTHSRRNQRSVTRAYQKSDYTIDKSRHRLSYRRKMSSKRFKNLKIRRQSRRKYWKKISNNLHFWLGRYWPNIYQDLSGIKSGTCSNECLRAVILLNQTVYGLLLANCNCRHTFLPTNRSFNLDKFWNRETCLDYQSTAHQCRPRLLRPSKVRIGCTSWRVICQSSPKCNKLLQKFLRKCSKVTSGRSCPHACRKTLISMKKVLKRHNTCVCDGTDKPNCEKIKSRISNLCFSPKSRHEEWRKVFWKRKKKSRSTKTLAR